MVDPGDSEQPGTDLAGRRGPMGREPEHDEAVRDDRGQGDEGGLPDVTAEEDD